MSSSRQNSDEDDSDSQSTSHKGGASASKSSAGSVPSSSYKERRREAHTAAEQKRRDAIKRGYDFLQELVPAASTSDGGAGSGSGDQQSGTSGSGAKVSKAAVLQRSIDYIHSMQAGKDRQLEELAQLKKEVAALQIMKANYEQLVIAHKSQPQDSGDNSVVPSEIKFETFRQLMDSLFVSFEDSVPMDTFGTLSGGVFSWLEEQCKPQILQELMYGILQGVKEKFDEQRPEADKRTEKSTDLSSAGRGRQHR